MKHARAATRKEETKRALGLAIMTLLTPRWYFRTTQSVRTGGAGSTVVRRRTRRPNQRPRSSCWRGRTCPPTSGACPFRIGRAPPRGYRGAARSPAGRPSGPRPPSSRLSPRRGTRGRLRASSPRPKFAAYAPATPPPAKRWEGIFHAAFVVVVVVVEKAPAPPRLAPREERRETRRERRGPALWSAQRRERPPNRVGRIGQGQRGHAGPGSSSGAASIAPRCRHPRRSDLRRRCAAPAIYRLDSPHFHRRLDQQENRRGDPTP